MHLGQNESCSPGESWVSETSRTTHTTATRLFTCEHDAGGVQASSEVALHAKLTCLPFLWRSIWPSMQLQIKRLRIVFSNRRNTVELALKAQNAVMLCSDTNGALPQMPCAWLAWTYRAAEVGRRNPAPTLLSPLAP